MPQKVCGRYISHVMAYAFFDNAPKSNSFNSWLFSLSKKCIYYHVQHISSTYFFGEFQVTNRINVLLISIHPAIHRKGLNQWTVSLPVPIWNFLAEFSNHFRTVSNPFWYFSAFMNVFIRSLIVLYWKTILLSQTFSFYPGTSLA